MMLDPCLPSATIKLHGQEMLEASARSLFKAKGLDCFLNRA
jgi:hypothetical protein